MDQFKFAFTWTWASEFEVKDSVATISIVASAFLQILHEIFVGLQELISAGNKCLTYSLRIFVMVIASHADL